ncbi:two-component system response regulator YesN [Paenibacillus anaericanus]|uniref:response regulator transcription factor n=1 Tax=Paenibacillus anaericanus TaxID=170367 RepID=UPI002787BCDE|nr:response regulator [Paenibacillus anaericanus]MDQ0089493.1 two-component system response regulator YesN [Paenibacillus anaericanus]
MNILIVDDELAIREGIKRTIQKAYPQYGIYLAANPDEAVQLLRSRPIDIVLTDILMPGMTGLELMQLTKAKYPNIKWVIISAYSEFEYAKEAVRLGAVDYLLKPIGKDMLLEMIVRLSDKIGSEVEIVKESKMLKNNLKFLREAVFQRWASGLNIGGMDMASVIANHQNFQLIMVKMESDKLVHLEHFIIDNVLTEMMDTYGKGFATSFDAKSVLGLITINEEKSIKAMLEQLRIHLKKYLRVPFQILQTEVLYDFDAIPNEVRRMHQDSISHEFEYYATGGSQVIEVALQYIRTYYNTDLTLEKVASIVYLNPVYFSQVFKQKTGYGFKEYVIHLRMEQAKQLLLHPQLKLADISEKVGYQDVKHFTQVFRKKFNVTPTEYRQEHRIEIRTVR